MRDIVRLKGHSKDRIEAVLDEVTVATAEALIKEGKKVAFWALPYITPELFKAATGCDEHNDDLERVHCQKTGEMHHYHCGWCRNCDHPAFMCGCKRAKP